MFYNFIFEGVLKLYFKTPSFLLKQIYAPVFYVIFQKYKAYIKVLNKFNDMNQYLPVRTYVSIVFTGTRI